MNGQLNSLESFDSGSNYRFGDKMIHSNVARSLFDLSHLNTLTIPRAGMLIPITWFETLPGDDHDINVDCLLRVLPQVVPLYSRQRLYIYGFYSRYSDLWNNWQVFMDKGYTGNDNRTIPYLHKNAINGNSNISYYGSQQATDPIAPDTLFDYIGIPIGGQAQNLFNINNGSLPTAYISALPFMMYLRIYRDYFMNKNHWINDRVMLPDDDSRFRLDDDGILLSAKDQNKSFEFAVRKDGVYDLVLGLNTYIFSGAMHDYPDDYFTSALPWPQRGTPNPLQSSGTISGNLDFSALTLPGPISGGSANVSSVNLGSGDYSLAYVDSNTDLDASPIITALNKGTFNGSAISLNITLEQIRGLALNQQMLDQLARTDGSYFQFGLSFFGEPSKAAYDYRPTYIGGTYKNIAFTEVLQTATTQTTQGGNTVDNPAGAYVGHGITGISSGRIGHIHCDDFGMIMLIACIMPDVYYSQGLDKTLTERTQEEKFLPDRTLLGLQPILNKELYYAGNNGNSQGDDNYLWAYQNPFDHLRYKANMIHGKIADPNSLSFYPYTQARHFTQLINWGRTFSSTNDVRQDYLTAPSEDAYTAQFSMNIRSVRPLPYKATPAKLVHM